MKVGDKFFPELLVSVIYLQEASHDFVRQKLTGEQHILIAATLVMF
jgi:hypothetical protein